MTAGEEIPIDVDDTDGSPMTWALLQDGSCAGHLTVCDEHTDGHNDESGLAFTNGGTWILVVTRDPAGPYTFALLDD